MTYKKMQRSQEGTKAGIVGLGCNLILAAVKFLIGITANSIIIIADAANNLTDGISALLTIGGFCMETRKKDKLHPYGHGRIEYVTGFLISLLILGTGISVGKEAVRRIFHPKTVVTSELVIIVAVFSIFIKLGMMFYYRWKNKNLNSPALEAMRKDSLNDTYDSLFTLVCLFIMPHSTVPLDGILGLVMAGHIAISGAASLWDNLILLLGEGISQETEIELRTVLSEFPEIESVEEIMFHDYGPDKKVAVAAVNFVINCDKDAKRRVVDNVIQFCRDTMNIELSLYSSLY